MRNTLGVTHIESFMTLHQEQVSLGMYLRSWFVRFARGFSFSSSKSLQNHRRILLVFSYDFGRYLS
jgi:hypothetical protein